MSRGLSPSRTPLPHRLARTDERLRHVEVNRFGAGGGFTPLATFMTFGSQYVPPNTLVVVSGSGTGLNSLGAWDAMHPTRLTAPATGLYIATSLIGWQALISGAGQEGYLRSYIKKNGASQSVGAQTHRGVAPPATDSQNNGQNISVVIALTAGDYLEFSLYQTSGFALTTDTGAEYTNHFSMTRLA